MTLLCNMQCLHCGSRAGKRRHNELSEGECLNIADQLIEMGNEHVTLIGGEILLVPHWYKIAKHFIRNKKGSFKNAIDAINKLKEENFRIGIVTTILDLNFAELEKMYQILKKLDVYLWQLQIASPMGRCEDNKKYLLSVDKVPMITKFIYEKRFLGDTPILIAADNIGYYNKHDINIRSTKLERTSYFTGCAAGLFNVGIDSVGNVRGCQSLYSEKFIEGNLRQNSLNEIWHKKDAFSYNRNFKFDMLNGKCKDCDKGYVCAGGCRQISYFSSEDKCFYNNIYCSYKSE